jgi:hypothetical protein
MAIAPFAGIIHFLTSSFLHLPPDSGEIMTARKTRLPMVDPMQDRIYHARRCRVSRGEIKTNDRNA